MKDVIVMGGNYSLTLGVTRSLGEAGFNVRLLVSDKWTERIAGSSKYVTECCNCLGDTEKENGLGLLKTIRKVISLYRGDNGNKGNNEIKTEIGFDQIWSTLEKLRGNDDRILIIPVSDIYCMMLDAHANDFTEHYFIPNCFGNPGQMTYHMDKMIQKELARQCGLKTAFGNVYSTDEYGIQEAVNNVSFPCFMRALQSANVIAGKNLHSECKIREELCYAMKKAACNNCSKVLIEDYLEIEKDLCVYGVAGNNQVFIPGCLEALRSGCGGHKGVTAEGIFVSAESLGEIKQKLEEFVKRSGLTGLFCIDLVLSKGIVYFIEMNLRCGASIYGATMAGANLPATLANMVYKQYYKIPVDVQRKSHFVSEMIEIDTCRDGFITYSEYKTHLSGMKERLIKNEEDPVPWKEFQKLEFRQHIKYILIRVFAKWKSKNLLWQKLK